MLDQDEIVFRLRARCPIFDGRVFGAAEFEDALAAIEEGKATIDTPSAYVAPLGFEAGENTLLDSLQQEVEEAFVVTVYFDNSQDRSGRTAAAKFPAAMAQLNKALLNWEALPGRTKNPIVSAGAEPVGANRAIAGYQFTYRITWYFGAEDGYDEFSEDLNEITLEDPNHPSIEKRRIHTGAP